MEVFMYLEDDSYDVFKKNQNQCVDMLQPLNGGWMVTGQLADTPTQLNEL